MGVSPARALVLVGLVAAVGACGASNDDAVVASGRHCLVADDDVCTRSVTVASSGEELEAALAAWGYERLSVVWPGHPVLFLPSSDTSACHPVVTNGSVEGETVELETDLTRNSGCTTEYIPYSFVIDPGAEVVTEVTVNGKSFELVSV